MQVNIADGVFLISALLDRRVMPVCQDAGDANDDGAVALDDAYHVFAYRLLDGPAPPGPFPECGFDATDDAIDCGAATPGCF